MKGSSIIGSSSFAVRLKPPASSVLSMSTYTATTAGAATAQSGSPGPVAPHA
jgi:hypothetical protein